MNVELRGKRVLVVGLGIEGVDLVRYALTQGAAVTANDARSADRLAESMSELDGLSVEYALGGHGPALAASHDVLFVSQGVPLDLPLIGEARRLGRPVASMMGLFLSKCPGPVAGITGSSGKTTTTSLVAAMFAEAGVRHIVGGNIGLPLLFRLDEIDAETWAVLEISHTQLELADRSPHVAAVTNVTPNHLDRYTWDDYVQLKRNIVAHQGEGDIAVLNRDDHVARSFARDTKAGVRFTTMSEALEGDGAYLPEGVVTVRTNGADTAILPASAIPLRGRHNIENVLTAAATATACGIETSAISAAIRSFRGVPHRLETVATVNGVTWVNDSIATSPERTLAGLRSYSEPVVLLLGGREKHLPLQELAREAVTRCRAVVCFGEARSLLSHTVAEAGGSPAVVATMEEAVEEAARAARTGDVVLLSPACTSFDAYDNFERRGEAFREMVASLARRRGQEVPS